VAITARVAQPSRTELNINFRYVRRISASLTAKVAAAALRHFLVRGDVVRHLFSNSDFRQ
jgi:hypothetical protein